MIRCLLASDLTRGDRILVIVSCEKDLAIFLVVLELHVMLVAGPAQTVPGRVRRPPGPTGVSSQEEAGTTTHLHHHYMSEHSQ